jgi:hypothetical protein
VKLVGNWWEFVGALVDDMVGNWWEFVEDYFDGASPREMAATTGNRSSIYDQGNRYSTTEKFSEKFLGIFWPSHNTHVVSAINCR